MSSKPLMASPSTSSLWKSYKYDVFLSFRGEDTRKKFVDHLYAAFERQGIHTYKDDERLEKGKRINNELLKAIEESKFCIIVFSKNYASSSWCLDELVKIIECQKATEQTVYPVFYDVEPSKIRKQRWTVGETFFKHNKEQIRKWRHALKEAANLVGWDLKNTANGNEAKVIKIIVEKVSLELRSIHLSNDESLVGMEVRVQNLESSLDIGLNDIRMIGIKGMGGGGKTTLARAIFDKVSIKFEGISFVENVREVSKAFGLEYLQKKVLAGALKDQDIVISSVHDGKIMMKRRMGGKKVLIVLDDVDHICQLEALAGALDWFKLGSRIIITTRDEQVLLAHRVKCIHEVSLLTNVEAICLFSRYAFGKNIPIQGYENMSLDVARYAAGLPLTIKVLGSFLCGRDELEWSDALKRLKTIPEKETLEKLELSYIDLEDDYKGIFLDVACFLKGWGKDYAIRMLESCGFLARNGLRVLEQKSLITINDDQDLGMHDRIEEMGRNIVRRLHIDDPKRHSRLWIREEVEDVLANDLVNQATRCIKIWGRQVTSSCFTNGFGNMVKLKFLIISVEIDYDNFYHDVKVDQVRQYFPNALQFLHWNRYPLQSLPKTFLGNNLVGLALWGSKIVQLWEGGERKVLKKLRFLDLSYSTLRTLDLGLAPNLERLHLKGCHDLVELHTPVGCLQRLVYLNLNDCVTLKSLSFIKYLESVKFVNLGYLSLKEFPDIIPQPSNNSLLELNFPMNDIEELPSSIGNIENLVSLYLNGCKNLKTLPGSICSLRYLRYLHLYGCALEALPRDFNHLVSLETLNLSCSHFKHLPNSISLLKHLKTLHLRHCQVLEKLPEDIGRLESLEKLDLAFCKIRDLPSSICMLKHLRELCLFRCDQLNELPEKLGDLICLKELNLGDSSINHLPQSISLLNGLRIIGFESKDRSIHTYDYAKSSNI